MLRDRVLWRMPDESPADPGPDSAPPGSDVPVRDGPLALPHVGLGTMGIDDPTTVETALDVGYRHLDTAQVYGNEAVVGEGLAASPVDRDQVVVATKLWTDGLAPDAVAGSARESRDRLGVDAIDLLYVHRPRGGYDPAGTLPAMAQLVDDGVVRHLGVSNFTLDRLATAREQLGGVPIAAHQTEYHPLFQRPGLVADAREHGYTVVAYSPLAGGRVFDLPELTRIAEKHGTSQAAVSIAWLAGMEGVVTVPKASSRAHLEGNLAAGELELDDEDVAAIEGIEREEELFPE
jgi:2,5-diketo-D-gluconate reductase B